MFSIGLSSDAPSFDTAKPLIQEPSTKSNSLGIIHLGIILGCLLAVGALSSCGSATTFDWKGYSQNMPVQKAKGTGKAPAIIGIGGWEGMDHMERVIGPLQSRVIFSEARVIAFGRWPDVMETIKTQHLNGHPIILIGYSAGCSDVLRISYIMEKSNIPVGLIFMDATYLRSGMFKPTLDGIENVHQIPSNVYMIENYVTHSPFGGRELTAADLKNPKNTKFRNNYIYSSHLNLLFDKYSDQYATSVRAIMNEYSRRY